MQELLGTSIWGSILVTVLVMGFAAYMTGHALAATWKPAWQVIVYCVLLGFADRFLNFALYDGELRSMSGFLIDTAFLVAVGLLAYRLSQARKMVSQYPWIYQRAGPLGWREKINR